MSLAKTLTDDFDTYVENITKKYKVIGKKPYSIDHKNICEELQKKLHNISVVEESEEFGAWITHEDNKCFIVNYDTEENSWELNVDMPEIVIPDDMLRFYSIYNACLFTHKKLITYDSYYNRQDQPKFLKLDKLYNATRWLAPTHEFFETDQLVEGDKQTVNMLDYFVFFKDPNSVQNNSGFFFTCLNPESIHYGEVFSYSSPDEGYFTKVASTFTEFLYLLSENADAFLNGTYYTDDYKDYGELSSICDFMCYYKYL